MNVHMKYANMHSSSCALKLYISEQFSYESEFEK